MQIQFKPDSESGKTLCKWWEELEQNKGDRAELRRCGTTVEVPFVEAFHDLWMRLCTCDDIRPSQLTATAGLLVHVKAIDTGKTLPQQLATPKVKGGKPALSELRFRRLLQCHSRDELFPLLRRALALLDGRADIYSLAESTYYWGDRIRRDWAYAYYGEYKELVKA